MVGGSRRTAALLAAMLLAGPALADPKGPTDKDKQVAGDLVKKAIARSQAGDHSAAIDIYLQAYTIVPNSILLSNIGTEYQQSGKPREALRYFCMYLDKDPDGTNAPYATSQAKALQILLGNKDVDEHDVCAAPEPRPVKPIKPRGDLPSHGDPPGITDEPKATTAQEGDTTLKVAGVACGVAGVAALGIGTLAGLKAQSISDRISEQPKNTPWPNDIKSLQKSGENYNLLAIGTLLGGGALVITGTILYVVSRPSAEPAHDKAAIHVTPTANGVAVFGSF
ncbi:MAG TPA: tetratricopeptide repeat protein [Kofleriaceae bacterium]|nr:tetratricopeptide repeat protein [Kofleriaceae bacterium]